MNTIVFHKLNYMKSNYPLSVKLIFTLFFSWFVLTSNNTFANIDTVQVSIPVSQIGSICVDLNDYPNGIATFDNFCPDQSGINGSFTVANPSSGCISFFGISEGISQGCFEICDPSQNCDTLILILLTEPANPLNILCDTIFAPDEINISVSDCNVDAAICLPLEFQILNTLDIFDDGTLYSGSLQGCNNDTTIAYSYANLIGQGNLGPYFLDSWTINGDEYSGNFPDISALLDSMNLWDTLGTWVFDTITPNTISGGFNDNFYGPIVASKPGVSNSTVVMGTNIGLTPLGGEIILPIGSHEISVLDNNNSCTDTVQINIACLPSDYMSLNTYVNVSGSICVDTSDLIGNFSTLENACASSGVSVDIFPGDICIDWDTQEAGTHQVCLVACDDLGYCDTTFITFHLTNPQTDTIDVIMAENETEYLCIDSTELIGNINNFIIISNPTNSNLTLDSIDYCLEIESTIEGNDFACVMICDDQGGCDTTCFSIIVNNGAAGFPVANDDSDTTDINFPLAINFLANDSTSLTDTVSIISAPSHGVLTLDSLGNYTYIPDPGICGFDNFTYEICNDLGCDQATVNIVITCDDVQVYNGFSPNGDGVNETFTITGLDAFPNHKVSVYNRWGNLVFESENYKSNWDGSWNGSRLGQGTYVYLVELNDNARTRYSGIVYINY